jgi:hypothetical protein
MECAYNILVDQPTWKTLGKYFFSVYIPYEDEGRMGSFIPPEYTRKAYLDDDTSVGQIRKLEDYKSLGALVLT